MNKRVVVIGAGVSGLAAAYALTKSEGAEVTIIEASSRLGGKISSNDIVGRAVDAGPDSLLIRDPAVKDLLAELGLTFVPPTARGSFVWTRGKLRTLPPATLFGVPERLRPLLTSGLVSWLGLMRAGADFVLPRLARAADPTVGELLRPRLGREVFDRLVDPLLGGIYAGRADRLSARSAVPEVAAILEPARSIYRTMRAREAARPKTGGAPAPVLVNFPGGMIALIHALAERTPAEYVFDTEVTALEMGRKRWHIRTATGQLFKADDVIVATPAHAAAKIVRSLDQKLAKALEQIPYADVANVTLVYPSSAIQPRQGTGFLVPAVDGRFIVGCTWMDQKWGRGVLIPSGTEHPQGEDVTIVRASVGRDGDNAWLTMSDAAIIAKTHDELVEAMGVAAAPLQSKVQRWPAAMPQYTVGHADRLAVIDGRLAKHPGLHITGAGYRGIGVASCLTKSQALAQRIGTNA